MAANKRYIIKVGDTVRIDPKKLKIKPTDSLYLHSWKEQIIPDTEFTVKSMSRRMNRFNTVVSIYGDNNNIVELLESIYSFPLEVFTKVINK